MNDRDITFGDVNQFPGKGDYFAIIESCMVRTYYFINVKHNVTQNPWPSKRIIGKRSFLLNF